VAGLAFKQAPDVTRRSKANSPAVAASGPAGHEAAEGFRLVAAGAGKGSPEKEGSPCTAGAPIRSYRVVAINVDITLNRYLDHDPEGRMYALEQDLERVRREEDQNARARKSGAEPAVTQGLQGDAIQPLAIRINQGECLRIHLRNALTHKESTGLHLHGAGLRVAGGPAIANNPKDSLKPGQAATYEWMVRSTEAEGTHYFHSHGAFREQTSHGLFGAVIVEPKGSAWLDPMDREHKRRLASGWAAVISPLNAHSFREFAFFYHEIGHENYRLLDKQDQFVPLVDDVTNSYRPGARAINYRSEPFANRLKLQKTMMGRFDEAVAYSSYVFGDPATPIARGYPGDPTKQRVIHAGTEVAHVHHVHGGAIRWRRQPRTEPSAFEGGLQKHPRLTPQASERTDSQTVLPSESFDIENECGAGGCQQSVGDFLIHCHVAHHYFAGMWGLWRVYNTDQNGAASTDSLPPLAALPGPAASLAPAVDSVGLLGRTLPWGGKSLTVDRASLPSVVEQQLPPKGQAKGYDASVLDWSKDGDTYLNEPESQLTWPGFTPGQGPPGGRRPFTFDPNTGKLAYPGLHPHLGKRPPFPPNHSPAPFLDPVSGLTPPAPGANGQASVCPEGTHLKQFQINAITVPITLNRKAGLIDPGGEIYVLRQQEDAAKANPANRLPLAIRANAGQDCIDVVLRNELADSQDNHGFAKVNIHIHFVQFDVQASDGVISGFNYEQSIRPFAIEGQKITTQAPAGATSLTLDDAGRFQPGVVVGVGMNLDEGFEVRKITQISGNVVTLDSPLGAAHAAGDVVSTEFVRSRWYPDVQFGTAYFHDHVNAVSSWRHGLFGALIAEPPDSTYHDPHSGDQLQSGEVADIHTAAPLSADVKGSFREMVGFIQDDNPVTQMGRDTGGSIGLRAEPLAERSGDPQNYFSSLVHGDPETPLLEAYLGDPLVFRTLVSGTNEVHTFHVDGHWFRIEPYSKTSPPTSTARLGISERMDLVVPKAGGPQQKPGDYLYYNGRPAKMEEGSWGLLRVLSGAGPQSLQKLPGHETAASAEQPICPSGAPQKAFNIEAVAKPVSGRDLGMRFVLKSTKGSGAAQHPLVLHVNVGDCIQVRLENRTDEPVSFHPDLLALDPKSSAGVNAGSNPEQTTAPGAQRSYTFYAHPELGETVSLVRDWGDVINHPRMGLYGAIVVGAPGGKYLDPKTGADSSSKSAWSVDVRAPSGDYRDFTLFLQDEDTGIGNHRMPYSQQPSGASLINYAAAPLADRLSADPDPSRQFASSAHGDPSTPLMEAIAGDPVRIHVLSPYSQQVQVFSIEGHRWPLEPGRAGTPMLSSTAVGGLEAVTLQLEDGAGGAGQLPGDYLYGNHRAPFTEAGMWGLFRVHPQGSPGTLKALTSRCIAGNGSCSPGRTRPGLVLLATIFLGGMAVLVLRRKKT